MFASGFDAPARAAQREDIIKALRAINGGRVLVVGGFTSRTLGALTRDPRVEVWDNDEMNRHPQIPANIRAVIMTRQVSHMASQNVIEQAAKRNLKTYRFAASAQEARDLLEEAFDVVAHPPLPTMQQPLNTPRMIVAETKPTETALEGLRPGSMTEYIARNANLSLPKSECCDAIWADIKKAFPNTTRDSVLQGIYAVKKKLGIAETGKPGGFRPPRATNETTISAKPAEAAAPIESAPAQESPMPTPASPKQLATPAGDDIVKLLDDAIVTLQLARDEMIRTAEIRSENARLKDKLRKLLED
jgi:hypothetical protein